MRVSNSFSCLANAAVCGIFSQIILATTLQMRFAFAEFVVRVGFFEITRSRCSSHIASNASSRKISLAKNCMNLRQGIMIFKCEF